MIGDAAADHASADDHDLGLRGQGGLGACGGIFGVHGSSFLMVKWRCLFLKIQCPKRAYLQYNTTLLAGKINTYRKICLII